MLAYDVFDEVHVQTGIALDIHDQNVINHINRVFEQNNGHLDATVKQIVEKLQVEQTLTTELVAVDEKIPEETTTYLFAETNNEGKGCVNLEGEYKLTRVRVMRVKYKQLQAPNYIQIHFKLPITHRPIVLYSDRELCWFDIDHEIATELTASKVEFSVNDFCTNMVPGVELEFEFKFVKSL